jgi:hypothetical protein
VAGLGSQFCGSLHFVFPDPKRFSCLGYLDQDGTWKSVFTNEALPDVTDFSPIA